MVGTERHVPHTVPPAILLKGRRDPASTLHWIPSAFEILMLLPIVTQSGQLQACSLVRGVIFVIRIFRQLRRNARSDDRRRMVDVEYQHQMARVDDGCALQETTPSPPLGVQLLWSTGDRCLHDRLSRRSGATFHLSLQAPGDGPVAFDPGFQATSLLGCSDRRAGTGLRSFAAHAGQKVGSRGAVHDPLPRFGEAIRVGDAGEHRRQPLRRLRTEPALRQTAQ